MAKRESVEERVRIAEHLMLGVPPGVSVEGAIKMERVVAYLYHFRAATLEQLTRCLPGQPERRVRFWLSVYPYIAHSTTSVKRYDVGRGEWIQSHRLGVYTLTREGLLLYERANGYQEIGYRKKGSKIDHRPNDVENTVNAMELFTRVHEVDSQLEWITNEWIVTKLRVAKVLQDNEKVSTTGFIRVDDENFWGITAYVNSTSAVGRNTRKTFQPQFFGVFNGITLVRDAHLGQTYNVAHKSATQERVNEALGYYRFVPYEFSLYNPKWFASVLRGNRWAVLEPLFEYVRSTGGHVEEVWSDVKHSRDEAFRWRITHGAQSPFAREVEYVDTTYGATFTGLLVLLSNNSYKEQARHTVYVVNQKEAEACESIAQSQRVYGLTFKMIDWPGGK